MTRNLVYQLFSPPRRRDEVAPAARPPSFRQAHDVLRDGIASAKIIEEPAIDLGGPQITLDSLNLCAHSGISSIARTRFISQASSVLHQQRQDLLPGHTAHFHAFPAASFAAQNSNSRPGCF